VTQDYYSLRLCEDGEVIPGYIVRYNTYLYTYNIYQTRRQYEYLICTVDPSSHEFSVSTGIIPTNNLRLVCYPPPPCSGKNTIPTNSRTTRSF